MHHKKNDFVSLYITCYKIHYHLSHGHFFSFFLKTVSLLTILASRRKLKKGPLYKLVKFSFFVSIMHNIISLFSITSMLNKYTNLKSYNDKV